MASNFSYNLLENVHIDLAAPTETGTSYLVKGDYQYFHYGCDGYMDAVSV